MINEKRREIQLETLEAFEQNGYNGFAILPTGTGKGWILIEAIKRIKPKKIIYLCDSEDNRDKTFKDELIKYKAEKWIPKIQFECYQTAYKYENEYYDLVLGDEVDFALTPEYSKFFKNNNALHKVLVSATLSDEKRELAAKIAPIIYEKNIQEIEDNGVLNQAEYYFVNYMLSPDENLKYIRFNAKFIALIREKEEAMIKKDKVALRKIIANINFWINQRSLFLKGLKSSKIVCKNLLKELYQKDEKNKILIFCGLTDQADAVSKYTYHGKSEKEGWFKKFDEGVIRYMAVCGKVDRGVNVKGINNIIFECPSKSNTKFVQKSGRGRRLEVDEILSIYFLIPYFKNRTGFTKPTVVQKWVAASTQGIDLSKAKIYKLS